MIISRKRYNDLIAKIDDAKRVVDAENKLIKAMLATKQERDRLERENEKLRKLKDIKEKALKGANYIIDNRKSTIKRLEEENAQLKEENEWLKER